MSLSPLPGVPGWGLFWGTLFRCARCSHTAQTPLQTATGARSCGSCEGRLWPELAFSHLCAGPQPWPR